MWWSRSISHPNLWRDAWKSSSQYQLPEFLDRNPHKVLGSVAPSHVLACLRVFWRLEVRWSMEKVYWCKNKMALTLLESTQRDRILVPCGQDNVVVKKSWTHHNDTLFSECSDITPHYYSMPQEWKAPTVWESINRSETKQCPNAFFWSHNSNGYVAGCSLFQQTTRLFWVKPILHIPNCDIVLYSNSNVCQGHILNGGTDRDASGHGSIRRSRLCFKLTVKNPAWDTFFSLTSGEIRPQLFQALTRFISQANPSWIRTWTEMSPHAEQYTFHAIRTFYSFVRDSPILIEY